MAASTIVLDGAGLGAAIAAETARRHPSTPALILENPSPPVLDLLQFDARTRLLPIHLLLHDRFDIRKTLAQVTTPRLVVYTANGATGRYSLTGTQQTVMVDGYADPRYVTSLRDFLNKYLSGK